MKKFFGSFFALLFAAAIVIAFGVGTSWFTNWNAKTWFNSWGKSEQVQPAEPEKPEETKPEGDETARADGVIVVKI